MGNASVGKITLNDKTQQHPETLKTLGYECEKVGDELVVQVPGGFVTDKVDFSTKEKQDEFLKDLIGNKRAVTYGTRFIVGKDEDGDDIIRYGFPMIPKLGAASALMMKVVKGNKKKKQGGIDMDALKALAAGESTTAVAEVSEPDNEPEPEEDANDGGEEE